jgi:hypothetical protein
MVFHDSAPTSTASPRSQATLGTNGTATITQDGRTMRVFANLSGLKDAPTHLVVTTTAGNEIVPCNEVGGAALCSGVVYGDPLIGGVVLLANNAALLSKGTIAQTAPLVVTDLTLSTSTTIAGSTYVANVVGSNLTAQTYFDIRVNPPGSSAPIVANNWQTGSSAPHSVVAGTPTGTWTITGVRAHQDPADHTGNFLTVSATLMIQ